MLKKKEEGAGLRGISQEGGGGEAGSMEPHG